MVSLRHTATALSILCEECADALSPSVEESIAAFFTRIEGYLSRNDDWKRDGYRHLTLGSVLKTCSQVAEKTDLQSLRERARSVAEAARNRLFSDECLHRDVSGECTWILPDPAQSSMARFQYYLDAFVLAQVPELMADARCQSIVRGMIENRIECRDGKGVPLRPLCNYGGEHPAPDFGASVSVAYLLFRCIESRLGDERWIEFCQEHFQAALDFCLRTYDKSTYYLLPHSENHSKALLLPACGARAQLPEFIVDLKEALNREMEDPKGKLRDLLRNVDTPPGLEHVKDLLLGWETSKYDLSAHCECGYRRCHLRARWRGFCDDLLVRTFLQFRPRSILYSGRIYHIRTDDSAPVAPSCCGRDGYRRICWLWGSDGVGRI
jgi:hypothetical protein